MLSKSISIQPKRSEDGEFIARLSDLAFGEYHSRASVYSLRVSERRDCVTLVARYGEAAVGFAIVSFQAPSPMLVAIAVEPQSRGLGVGKRLLARCEKEVLARGAKLLTLFTAEANVAALDLFLKSGYRISRREGRFYERRQNAVAMRKQLAS